MTMPDRCPLELQACECSRVSKGLCAHLVEPLGFLIS